MELSHEEYLERYPLAAKMMKNMGWDPSSSNPHVGAHVAHSSSSSSTSTESSSSSSAVTGTSQQLSSSKSPALGVFLTSRAIMNLTNTNPSRKRDRDRDGWNRRSRSPFVSRYDENGKRQRRTRTRSLSPRAQAIWKIQKMFECDIVRFSGDLWSHCSIILSFVCFLYFALSFATVLYYVALWFRRHWYDTMKTGSGNCGRSLTRCIPVPK